MFKNRGRPWGKEAKLHSDVGTGLFSKIGVVVRLKQPERQLLIVGERGFSTQLDSWTIVKIERTHQVKNIQGRGNQ